MGIRLPRRISLLWVLAALLGTAAIHGTMRVLHHPVPSGAIMGHFAEIAARYAASAAEGRLQTVAREAFMPAARRPGSLAVLETMTVDSTALGGAAPLSLHFVADPAGKQRAILTALRYDAGGTAVGGSRVTLDAGVLMADLFGAEAMLDPSSTLEVTTTTGAPLFRTSGAERPYHATIHPGGMLSELSVTANLAPPTGMLASFRTISRDQLTWSGVLLISTILVIVIAAVSSRREALLARARSDFIAGVSHELRMPLAQIMLASETLSLEREPDSKRQLGLATSIVREARRLAGLVDNVLLVARSGATKLKPIPAAVPVESLFLEVEESVQLAVDDAGQRLEVRAAPGLAVQGDRLLLRQALTNLIDNALKYGGAGGAIRLGAERLGESVHLYVENDGPGIPAALRARLFLPYERLPKDQISERTGSGLGLSVVAQIAGALGGKVWLEDGKPTGTRAVLALKAVPAP